MATRFSVSLAHAGCDHTGLVIWEQRERAGARGTVVVGPAVLGLPRGFVSLTNDDGSIEVVCAGCRQTVASAARGEPTSIAVAADGGAMATAESADHADGETPVAPVDAAAPVDATAPVDAATEDAAQGKVLADLEALFDQAEDVAPIRGDAIPPHLFDKLHHLADRMRQRR